MNFFACFSLIWQYYVFQPDSSNEENDSRWETKLDEVVTPGGKTKPLIPEMCFIYSEENIDYSPPNAFLEEDGTSLLISCAKCRVRVHASKWISHSSITGFSGLRIIFVSHRFVPCRIYCIELLAFLMVRSFFLTFLLIKVWVSVIIPFSTVLCSISESCFVLFVCLLSRCGVIVVLLLHTWILLILRDSL